VACIPFGLSICHYHPCDKGCRHPQ
jgi:hypothetical protein